MNDSIKRIEYMENVLDKQINDLQQLEKCLDVLDKDYSHYQELIAYYYSDERNTDLTLDDTNQLPKTLKRGVLSEDAIYNMMADRHELLIRMLETATKWLKND
ncbi:DUF4298 domain-containing protein [Carnobacteriaceae bacterium zg-ZUI78]|nr:DUF4298 domain-containing protein [Carnobacteriaceae bacterium zg-ZUI78]